jgi:hypothetical protein
MGSVHRIFHSLAPLVREWKYTISGGIRSAETSSISLIIFNPGSTKSFVEGKVFMEEKREFSMMLARDGA